MKIVDKRKNNTYKKYKYLNVGDVFVWRVDNVVYIKITDEVAFDIYNNIIQTMNGTESVEIRNATLTLD